MNEWTDCKCPRCGGAAEYNCVNGGFRCQVCDLAQSKTDLAIEIEHQRKVILASLGLTEEQMKLATLAGEEMKTGPAAYQTLSATQRVALAKEVMRQDALEAVAKAAKRLQGAPCRWEYRVVRSIRGLRPFGEKDPLPKIVLEAAMDLGREGWEMSVLLPTNEGATVFFKRPVEVK